MERLRNRRLRGGAAVAVLFGALAASAPAQAPASTSAPAPVEGIEQRTPQGLRVWGLPGDVGGRFVLGVLVGFGSRDEDSESLGLACQLQRVLLKSTRTHAAIEADAALAQHGGKVVGRTTHECSLFRVDVPAAEWRFAIDWLAEHLLQPAFAYADVTAVRQEVFDLVHSGRWHDGQVTYERLLYPESALGRPVASERNVAIETVVLQHHFAHRYKAGNMAIAFAGSVPAAECRAAIASAFAPLPGGAEPTEEHRLITWTGRGDWVNGEVGGALTTGFHLPAGDLRAFAVLQVLTSYLRAQVDAVAARGGEDASLLVVRADYRDRHRLQFDATTARRLLLQPMLDGIDELLAGLASPQAAHVEAALAAQRAHWRIDDVDAIDRALQVGWIAARRGGTPDQLLAQVGTVTAVDLAEYAQRELLAARRYTISNAPVGAALPTWVALVALFGLLLAIDAWRGFPATRGARRVWRERRARRVRHSAATAASSEAASPPAPGAIRPGDPDDLIRSIQRYLDDEGKDKPK